MIKVEHIGLYIVSLAWLMSLTMTVLVVAHSGDLTRMAIFEVGLGVTSALLGLALMLKGVMRELSSRASNSPIER